LADANPSSGGAPAEPPDTTRGGARGERAIAALGSGARRLGRWAAQFVRDSIRAWRYLDGEQRVAAIACALLIVSTFGPFSFVEGAVVLVALAVLLLLKKRGDGRSFHLPFGDGAVIMTAGAWSALLIVVRLFDRPLGQNLLALVCATLLALAGLRMRLRRPTDDLPQERARRGDAPVPIAEPAPEAQDDTAVLPRDAEVTRERTRRVRRQTPAPAPPAPPPPPRSPAPPAPVPPPPAGGARKRGPDPDFDLPEQLELQPPPAERPAPEQSGPFRARPADPPE
jgi:hypothetical protein